jgi:hypothetical protein
MRLRVDSLFGFLSSCRVPQLHDMRHHAYNYYYLCVACAFISSFIIDSVSWLWESSLSLVDLVDGMQTLIIFNFGLAICSVSRFFPRSAPDDVIG